MKNWLFFFIFVAAIYLMFVFQKVSEPTEEKSTDQEETSDTTTEQERGEKRASSEAEEGEEPTEKVAKTWRAGLDSGTNFVYPV